MKREEVLATLQALAFAALAICVLADSRPALWVALTLLACGLTDNPIGRGIAMGWRWLAARLGDLNARLLLFLTFYGLLTPIALVYRWLNRAAIERFFARADRTYFQVNEHDYDRDSLEKPW